MVTAVSSAVVSLSAAMSCDRGDGDGDGGGLGDAARGHRVGVAVGAVEVGVGRVGDGAVAVVDDRAVGALGHAGHDRRALEVSLASTLVVTAVSSAVVSLSAAMSATAVTVTVTVAVSVTPPEVTV